MRTLRVVYHREAEGWWAESPDLPGFSAAADSFDALRAQVSDGIPFALEDTGDGSAVVLHIVGAIDARVLEPSSEASEITEVLLVDRVSPAAG